MLNAVYAHPGHPVGPDSLWSAWTLAPVLLVGLGLSVCLFLRGWKRMAQRRRRATWFAVAVVALVVALISPLDALSDSLASAHMVQHVLLLLVAAPMLALADAPAVVFAGLPRRFRKFTGRLRRDLGLNPSRMRVLRHPTVVWLLHAGTVWFWHAGGPYDAALENEWIHQLEHVVFLVTAVLFWRVLVAPRLPIWPCVGYRVLLVFTMAVQSVILAALITFAETPWYSGYAETTEVWNLTPLADQQLAGVIMWIPSGPIYTVAGLVLLVTWIRQSTSTRGPGRESACPEPEVVAIGDFPSRPPMG